MQGRLFAPQLQLPGVYIECGPDTPPELRRQVEMERAAIVLPIPYRPTKGPSLESALRDLATAFHESTGRRLRPGDRP